MTTPEYRPRPELDHWIRDHGLDYAQAAKLFGCAAEFVRLMCLPFDDPARKKPGRRLMAVIVRVTQGKVKPGDFYPAVADILAGAPA